MAHQILPPIDYYNNEDNWGSYQYVSLSQLVNNFMLEQIGDDRLLSNVKRYNVLQHFKRGIQEFNYDTLKEIKVVELELSDSLLLTLPHDFVSYVRVSVLGADGLLRTLSKDSRTLIGTAYLQDHEFNILFDENGYPLEANETETFKKYNERIVSRDNSYCDNDLTGPNYGLNPSLNANGYFSIDKRKGVMSFSSNIGGRVIVLEYVSDGLEYNNGDEVMVHKLAEQALYSYVKYAILNNKYGVQEYIINRAKKDYYRDLQNANIRMLDLRGGELFILFNGRKKWLK
ncbi:structural protein [Flavobacterium phage vB_FspP_elemoA_1-9C]|jgi:hypothetical protein|uniref:Structural protein n=6 Tax=Elemovirus TaxID=2948694 RepID=A0A7D7JRX9_9CAUD|nr:virion structural protein [Flavobacterium phage vB_FspP_elemoA_7-9A]YP_010108990.1 virion structural protein [Flavobacterium phage vB_FspP_elemoF_6-3D]YP_010109078.1 virion structural protein [Flavobacterium phage vB_FspP_elemoE_6-9C]YP_010109164.1 virion structural protein [Flavobacterium phage vB_FspP_elemoD_13-5B]YP_010356164.1 virion structural protein [Flavobacterium phage vB_FspP_elemoB_14-3B]YP_010356523.1 virion structural protein [Flavobacterium phage vB_FspP_elemoC_14-1A]QMP84704